MDDGVTLGQDMGFGLIFSVSRTWMSPDFP